MEEIEYNLVFSRRRTISIIINPDKTVTVRAPFGASLKKINKFVLDKSVWIRKHLNSTPGIRLVNNEKKYFEGELYLFLGREYALRKTVSDSLFVRINDHEIEVGYNDISDSDKIKRLLDQWYIQKAGEILSNKMKEIICRYNEYRFTPTSLVIRSLKSRWGSCTSKGKITLNSELIKLDPVLIDYVIIHELCHRKYHNHGSNFYKLLEELVPDYKSIRKELRKYNTY